MRALYVKPKPDQVRWAEPTAVAVSPLVAELIGYLSDRSTEGTTRRHAEELLLDLLHPVPTAAVEVRPPQSDPARALAAALVADPTDRRTLADWGRHVGASERTLARAFIAETGLPFGRWRTLVRLQAALPELAAGRAVATVARQVGYDTTSAFVAAFRREIGLTPGSYFQPAPGRPLSSRPASSRPASSMRVSGRPDE
jgi:AraC-like DNA-binding protein